MPKQEISPEELHDDTVPAEDAEPKKKSLAGPIALAVAGAIVVGAGGYALGHNQAATAARAEQGAHIVGPSAWPDNIAKVHRRVEHDPFALGEVDAPVVMSMFSDFDCPFCVKFATETEGQLIDEYVRDGKLRIEWNDFAINGPTAVLAAEAGRAAAAQGAFWEFQSALYERANTDAPGKHPEFTLDQLIDIARDAGVSDIDAFRADIESGRFGADVMLANGYAAALGMNATPTFIINEQVVPGALPYEKFKEIIDGELEKAAPGE
ncbi:Thiol:disulfide interchange protein DsbA [Corynebacterium renale]|uniref:DsbA family protein n=1 Tax=Corynebacterium renale TaxID=1724 RepID=UPI000DA28FB3|nr:thioredoxin domain-containing protein [Corynebacterium renale]SQG63887.1 Thiol:disulfide interchange protein DsbA [Corynebacterium renale]STD02681.1 Thiol:disulfide interchange protein DsbA [Corynebacterium renale]